MNEIKLDNFVINNSSEVFIIAEAGVNHNGDLVLAKRLVDEAKEAGANAVKFQSFCTEELITKDANKADYQLETTDKSESQFEMLKKLELSFDEQKELKDYCDSIGVMFLSTPFEKKSLDFLSSIDVCAFKISSTDTNNILFLKQVADKGKPIILSTGMSNLSDVERAVNVIKSTGNEQIIILHCTANYPAPPEDCNISAITTLKSAFKTFVGYSDHTEGIGISPYTVPLGTKVIEKHFTLDKSMEGPDHKASLDPEELKNFVKQIRYVEKALGDGIKRPMKSERSTKKTLQKKIVLNKDLSRGDMLTEDSLIAKRTNEGVSAEYFDLFIGKRINIDLKQNTPLNIEYIRGG